MTVRLKNRYSFAAILIALLVLCSRIQAQQRKVDSLEKILLTSKEDTNKVKILGTLCWGLEDLGELDKAKKYADISLQLSKKIQYKQGIANAYNEIGIIFLYQGDYPTALKNFGESMTIRKELNDKKNIATMYSNMGYAYMSQGNIPEALKNDFAALKMREALGDKEGLAACYNNIGIIFMYQDNFPEALKNYQAALKLEKEIGNLEQMAGSNLNIGIIYAEQGRKEFSQGHKMISAEKYALAYQSYADALKSNRATGNKKGIADAYHDLGVMYAEQGSFAGTEGDKETEREKYAVAIEDQERSIKIKVEIGDKQGLADSYDALGDVYMKLKDPAKAKKYYSEALSLSREIGSKNEIMASYSGLSEAGIALGESKNAYENYKLFILYRDSLKNEENTKKTVEAQMQYEFGKTQLADSTRNAEKLKQDALRHEQEIKQQRIYTYGGLLGFLLMLIVAGASFNAYRQKQSTNRIITEQKNLVEMKQKEILDSIHYAGRIQKALLPPESYIEKSLKRMLK